MSTQIIVYLCKCDAEVDTTMTHCPVCGVLLTPPIMAEVEKDEEVEDDFDFDTGF